MRVRRLIALVGVPAVVVSLAVLSVSTAPNPTVRATLSGYEETPLTLSTPGAGTFAAKIADGAIEYELSYSGLEAPAFAAHIHLGRPATTGGVIAFLCGGGGQAMCPPAGGMVTGTITAANVVGSPGQGIASGEFDELVSAILNGATYVNVHTTARPGGEVRGQITGVAGN